jgi:DNA-binding response OmpR family regulator
LTFHSLNIDFYILLSCLTSKGEEFAMFTVKVLLISRDLEAGEMLAYGLRRRGLEVMSLDSIQQAVEQWRTDAYALAIVNECDNSLNGPAQCEALRQEATLPILLLTHERNELYSLKAYQAGVNECITKPIGTRLLLAKVMTWLRCTGSVPTDSLPDVTVGGVRLEVAQRRFRLPGGRTVTLTNLEMRLLHLLMSHPGQALEPAMIVEHVWGYRGENNTDLLKHVVYRLRRKIEPDPTNPVFVQTMAGAGYAFIPQ